MKLDFDKLDFLISCQGRCNPVKCKSHPKAPVLTVDDDQELKCTSYCLGCLYELLKKTWGKNYEYVVDVFGFEIG